MKRKKYLLAVGAGIAGIMVSAGGTAAYLSKSVNEARNVFTAGSVSAQLTEAHWDAVLAGKTYPGQVLKKDPAVENTGENDANVFLEVNIPLQSISILDQNTGKKLLKENRELFRFQADDSKWMLLSKEQTQGNRKYVYGYKAVLKPGETTVPLFQEIAMVPYLEGELDTSKSYDVSVIASVIQKQDDGKTMKEVYQEYIKQYENDKREGIG